MEKHPRFSAGAEEARCTELYRGERRLTGVRAATDGLYLYEGRGRARWEKLVSY